MKLYLLIVAVGMGLFFTGTRAGVLVAGLSATPVPAPAHRSFDSIRVDCDGADKCNPAVSQLSRQGWEIKAVSNRLEDGRHTDRWVYFLQKERER